MLNGVQSVDQHYQYLKFAQNELRIYSLGSRLPKTSCATFAILASRTTANLTKRFLVCTCFFLLRFVSTATRPRAATTSKGLLLTNSWLWLLAVNSYSNHFVNIFIKMQRFLLQFPKNAFQLWWSTFFFQRSRLLWFTLCENPTTHLLFN